jgi:glycyl-tRNA synthetase, tetrameric type, beta subunit
MAEFLLELLSEEIPARMQARAADDLKRLVCQGLDKSGLAYGRADAFVTPRRLTLVVDGLPERQPDVTEERKGPRVGSPDKAVQGFLRAAGLASVDQAEVRETDKGQFYFAVSMKSGRPTADVLSAIVGEMLAGFPWPKSMRWGRSQVSWVRPLHNILAVFAGKPIALTWELGGDASLTADASTRGHRFLAPSLFTVSRFADYRERLRAAKVVLDPAERRKIIRDGAERLATAEGLVVRDDPGLLDEVTGLVEWPIPMIGRIDDAFMDVPAEVLITAMRAHQKYFSLLDADGALAPRFVLVANTETADGGAAIVAGNERVLRARLSDAKYFWDQDRKRPLATRVPKLAERVFHAKLGSDLERVARLEALAGWLAPQVGADADLAARAANLCKADLMSQMVGEFPELQGIMGRYYALNDGEPTDVADAIAEHYAPKGPSDRCPTAPVAVAVALADKLDTLVGFFAIGEKPTGSGDPFALRRAALGVIRLIIENKLRLHLGEAFRIALSAYPASVVGSRSGEVATELPGFFADRLKVHLREQNVRHDLISAVFGDGREDDLVRLLARVEALRDFLNTDDGANLLTAYRRASNIVRIEETKDGASYEGEVEPRLLSEQRETELYQALSEARERIAHALVGEEFKEAMSILAGLRPPVDAFFDQVQVNCADRDIRVNRLKLLSQIRSALGGVADFSQIEG